MDEDKFHGYGSVDHRCGTVTLPDGRMEVVAAGGNDSHSDKYLDVVETYYVDRGEWREITW